MTARADRRNREPASARPCRAARAEALAQVIALRGGRLRLNRSNYHDLDDRGLTRAAVDQAVDALAASGRITVGAEAGVVVLTGADGGAA